MEQPSGSLRALALTERISVREARTDDITPLAEMRFALWPDEPLEQRLAEATERVRSADRRTKTFVAETGGTVVGFAEVSLRFDYVDGCDSSPVAFLEGIYVRDETRRRGVGRALVEAAEQWGRDQGCSELASDARLDNTGSHRFHGGAGFEETGRVVYFRKDL